MKTLIYLLAVIALISCTTGNIDVDREYSDDGLFSVVTIDSCEYVAYHAGQQGGITHKGNCKFCAQRNRDAVK